MDRLWWELPGPKHFISQIVEDLRDGENVVTCLPEHAPKGLFDAVKLALGRDSGGFWHEVHVEDGQADPVDVLLKRFVREQKADAIWNAKTLSQNESFSGRFIMLDVLSASAWPAWKEFLEEYAHACRSQLILDRTLFLVLLAGELALDPPKEDVCLSHREWQGIVDRLDMLLFTSTIFRKRRMSALQKEVATSVIANIALWDPMVAQRLAYESIERILNPQPVLQQIAKERNWCETGLTTSPSWCTGTRDLFNGQKKIHSACLAFDDKHQEIRRRIWRGQVGVMLPFVEEKRQDFLTELGAILSVPYESPDRVIANRLDLEIGHIASQIGSNRNVPRETRQLVYRLRDIRNSLAHLEPLPHEELADIY